MQSHLEVAGQLATGPREQRRIHELQWVIHQQRESLVRLQAQVELQWIIQQQRESLARLQAQVDSIHASSGFRLLCRYYKVRNWLWFIGLRLHALARALWQAVRSVPTKVAPASEGQERAYKSWIAKKQERAYKSWIAKNEPDATELALQRHECFPVQPRISLVVLVYQPQPVFLAAMIESVLAQTYANWELRLVALCCCPTLKLHLAQNYANWDLWLAYGRSQNREVRRLLREYAAKDSRIRVTHLPVNKGPADNRNAALGLATGSFVALLDHDDTLAPFALHEVVKTLNEHPQADFLYSDEDHLDEKGQRVDVHFKPDWSPDRLRSHNYISRLVVFHRQLLESIGSFRKRFEGSHEYDLVLRATEQARQILHIPQVLYHRRRRRDSLKGRPRLNRAQKAGRRALEEHLDRKGLAGMVQHSILPDIYQVVFSRPSQPLISIIIPTKDQPQVLARCLESLKRSSYPHYEILLVENQSEEAGTFDYYRQLRTWPRLRLLTWDRPFNYAAINNYAATQACGEILLLLNNDTEVLTLDWLERLVEHALRSDVGAVGAKLYYPNDTIQHGGVILGLGGAAGHVHRFSPRQALGHGRRLAATQNLSAVTGACLMVRKQVFDEVGGFDERLAVAYNDVDLCMRIRRQGYWIVWTPHAELYHHESKTRGSDELPENRARFSREKQLFRSKWRNELHAGDPFYSPHLSLKAEDFSLRTTLPGEDHSAHNRRAQDAQRHHAVA